MEPAEYRLIAALYEGLASTEGWDDFLRQLRPALGAEAIDVAVEDHAGGVASAYGIVGFDPAFRASYDPRYVGDNPWMAQALLAGAPAVVGSPMQDPPRLEASDYYRSWLRPQSLRYMAGCVLRREGVRLTYFGALKGPRGGPFAPRALRLVARLRPHLCQATALTDRLAVLQVERDLALTALDARPEATLLAEADGRLIHLNRAAETLLEGGAALHLGRGGRLACRSLVLHRRLAAALRRAAGAAHESASLPLPRQDGPDLRLLVHPFVRRVGALPVTRNLALLTVADPTARPAAPVDLVRDGLGLTTAQARLAAALADGERLADYAVRAGIKLGTARTLLKRAMARTGASRQADLVRQVAMLARRHLSA